MKHRGHLPAGIPVCALLVALTFLGMEIKAWGQDAAKLDPQMYRVIFENDRYRVIDYHLGPGGKEPMHSHPNGVLVYLFTDAKVKSTLSDGRTSDSTAKAGDVMWRDPVTHRGENTGANEIHELLIEPKVSCQPVSEQPQMPSQDAPRLAPQMYRVIFENNRYRVIDYHLKPGDKEPLHSHPHGVLVYWFSNSEMGGTLADGKPGTTLSKAGEVLWRDPVTHQGQNAGSTEAHSLLIEPKSSCR